MIAEIIALKNQEIQSIRHQATWGLGIKTITTGIGITAPAVFFPNSPNAPVIGGISGGIIGSAIAISLIFKPLT